MQQEQMELANKTKTLHPVVQQILQLPQFKDMMSKNPHFA
jgi:hypothetical protein